MRVGIIAAILSAALLFAYSWLEPVIPFWLPFSGLVTSIAIVAILFSAALLPMTRGAVLAITSCLLTLAVIELVFMAAPSAFPDNLRIFVESHQPAAREAVVERLTHSPFFKPKPDVLVQQPGYYGPKETFVYEWTSDQRGFKNLPEVASLDKVDVVAVGNSFTEGLGVATEDTWASRLSRNGLSTYSLGIQGYAPTQFLGAYEHYGQSLSPRWVIIGLLGGVYAREQQFLSSASTPLQAIQRLAERDDINKQRPLYLETREGYQVPIVIRQRHRFVTSAAIALAAQQLRFAFEFDIAGGVDSPELDTRFTKAKGLGRYRGEAVSARAALDNATLVESPAWRSTEHAISSIASLARGNGAQVLLVFFPNRGTAFHAAVTGSALPSDASDLVQAAAARALAKRIGSRFLDLTPEFQKAAHSLTDANLKTESPYLLIDGHPSRAGHRMIAHAIYEEIRATQP